MVTLKKPFAHNKLEDLMHNIIQQDFRILPKHVDADLASVILKTLEKDQSKRPTA